MSLSSMMGLSARHTEAEIGKLKMLPSEVEHQYICQSVRYLDAISPEPVVQDPWVIDLHKRIEYNYDAGSTIDPAWVEWLAHRVRLHDEWCQHWLDEHAEKRQRVTVLRLCPGLDSKNLRMVYGRSVRWVDVDSPQVVDVRRKLLPRPHKRDYHLMKADILTEEWLRVIPNDRPTLIIAEHLFSWLPPKPAQELIARLTNHFTQGQLHMCVTGSLVAKMLNLVPIAKGSGLRINWGIDNPRQITSLNPRLRCLEALTDRDLTKQGFQGARKPPWLGGFTALTAIIPGGQTMAGYMRFAFDDYSPSIHSTADTVSTSSTVSGWAKSFRTPKTASSARSINSTTTATTTASTAASTTASHSTYGPDRYYNAKTPTSFA